jgi:excinuclease ABC subunit C
MTLLIEWSEIPIRPGIYKMSDADGRILYIGKAKRLRHRLRQYFQKDRLDLKTRHLMSHVAAIDTIVTQTENEALILESQLIKTYLPRYNILLKDDKHFPYIKITNAPFPRLLIVRQRESDGARYFGPYPSIGSTKFLLRLLLDLFPIRDCKQAIPLTGRQPKCIKLDIEKCIGPCVYKNIKPTYDNLVDQLSIILSGKDKNFIKKIEADMHDLAQKKKYEQAAILRDQLHKIRRLSDRQQVQLEDNATLHIWVHVSGQNTADEATTHWEYVLVQTFIEGKLLYQSGFYWHDDDDTTPDAFYDTTILNWYAEDREFPDGILTDATMAPLFSKLQASGALPKTVSITQPQKGERYHICQQATENAHLSLKRTIREHRFQVIPQKIDWDIFVRVLGLTKKPEWIFGFDISHLQGQDIVASAVAFRHGKPAKSSYRRFGIRSVVGTSNDPASLYEAVLRRLQLAIEEEDMLPDLLLIDGGKGQLNFAMQALDDLGLRDVIDCISLAKQEEIVYRVGRDPVRISEYPALRILQHIRDESHRFALRFQRMKRRSVLRSDLSNISGLGQQKIKLLYELFGSIQKIREADPSALEKVPGIGNVMASRIQTYLRRQHDLL